MTNPDLAKHNIKIKQNSSASKYGFRGLASSIKFLDDFESVFFYSYKFLNSKIENGKAKISYYDHYKTLIDLKNKNTLGEQTVGNILSWHKDNSVFGCNFIYTYFDHEIENKSKNQFQGRKNHIGSIFGETILFDRLNLFGEFTYLKTFSFISGSSLTFLKNITSSFLFRNLSPQLHNFYGKPFHENSTQNNELGICNVNSLKIKKLNATLSWDYFHFPQPTQKIRTSQHGLEKVLKVIYQFNKKDFISLVCKDKNKKSVHEKILSDVMTMRVSGQKGLGNFIFVSQLVYRIDRRKKDYGVGFMETMKYQYRNFNANIFLGTIFTRGVDIYLRTPTMKFCGIRSQKFNIPMLTYGGVVGYKFRCGLQIEFLYNFSSVYKGNKIGIGMDEIDGRKKNFFQLQIVY